MNKIDKLALTIGRFILAALFVCCPLFIAVAVDYNSEDAAQGCAPTVAKVAPAHVATVAKVALKTVASTTTPTTIVLAEVEIKAAHHSYQRQAQKVPGLKRTVSVGNNHQDYVMSSFVDGDTRTDYYFSGKTVEVALHSVPTSGELVASLAPSNTATQGLVDQAAALAARDSAHDLDPAGAAAKAANSVAGAED